MSYQVLARKWRPKSFEEVVGQSAAAQTLSNAILQNRIAHAYLFAGARGVGKTSTARILAKALNCVQGPTVSPCNACASCTEIAAGNSIDVLEIDAASNRGIDEIRELRENVKYAAARDRYKVFIIDEVHMLTTEAFNALLKTLEEPPPQVVFILATTELHKVPSTILSRCQHFNFRAISHGEILEQLRKITSEEHVQISDEALNAIARASEGSMRDAQSQLDQIISFCGNEIKDDQVRDLLGIVPQQLLTQFTTAIAESDSREVLLLVDRLVTSGLNLQHFVREMLAHFRNLLMIKMVGEDPKLIPLGHAEMRKVRELSGHFSEEDITRFFSILVAAETEMRWSPQQRFHLEMALAKLLQVRRLVSMESLLQKIEATETAGEPPKDSTQLPHPPATERFKAASASRHGAAAAGPKLGPVAGQIPSTMSHHATALDSLKSLVAQQSPVVSSLLEHALNIRHRENCLEIEFAPKDHFSFEMLQSAENIELVKSVMSRLVGAEQTVQVLMNRAAPQVQPSQPMKYSSNYRDEMIERVKEDAAVRSFLDTFHGEVIDVKESKDRNSK